VQFAQQLAASVDVAAVAKFGGYVWAGACHSSHTNGLEKLVFILVGVSKMGRRPL